MTHFRLTVIYLILLLAFSACHPAKNITGSYGSSFAVMGFFGTRIILMSDSTFTYRMRGDMMGDTANGKYQIRDQFLILSYDAPTIDTALYVKEAVLLSLSLASVRPQQFYIGHRKLFMADTLGEIYKKEQGLSKNKRYLLLGAHYMKKRKYYLKRID